MMRFGLSAISSPNTVKLAGLICLASVAAGCSSGVTRFDHGLKTGSIPEPVSTSSQVATGPALAQPYRGDMSARTMPQPLDTTYNSSLANGGYQRPVSLAQPSHSQSAVLRQPLSPAPSYEAPATDIALAPLPTSNAPLPSSARRSSNQMASYGVSDPVVTGAIPTAAPRRGREIGPVGWSATGGTSVTVGYGETLYNLSRRYGVPAKEIMKANNLSDPSSVEAGQVVIIPTYVYSHNTPVSAPDYNPNTRAARASTGYPGETGREDLPVPTPSPVRQVAVLPNGKTFSTQHRNQAAASATANANQTSSAVYTVQPGDTLSRIASRAGVSITSLKTANGLSTATIRVGQKLILPTADGRTAGVQTASAAPVPARSTEPTIIQQASLSGVDDGETPKATGIGKLRWPARGQVMNSFGAANNGTRNDGIDISLPQGTPVKAAENGVVIYAGSGLKEYGNTVLVRHDNGLVSVYGHASELIVQRGDNVSRGQVVALSGMSGQATRPKLHFEIRKDAKPVDPLSYLE